MTGDLKQFCVVLVAGKGRYEMTRGLIEDGLEGGARTMCYRIAFLTLHLPG
jgi:hypothetical protein